LHAKFIGKVGIGLYAHETYIAAFGMPASVAALADHCVIGFDQDSHSFRAVGAAAARLGREAFGFRCDSDQAQLAALRAGLGIGGCQTRIAMRDPALIGILPDTMAFELEIWLAMHEDLKSTRRIRLLFDHLSSALAHYAGKN
jgi:DNA-binding transcriptional LysR family regulator